MKKGFTLIELLVVIGIIAILAVIVLVAVNPARQFAQARNAQRTSDVTTVLNAIHQEAVDNNGTINAAITAACPVTQAVLSGAGTGANLAALAPTYVSSLPEDPTSASGTDTGYDVCVDTSSRVTVSSPDAELEATISVTR
jgi:type IV pilus assembly protein PilA